MAATRGARMYLVRLALGDGVRTAMPQRQFAELLAERGGNYDAPKVSRQETDQQPLTLEEVELIASVDPLSRGPAWLAFGEEDPPKSKGVIPLEPPQEPYTGDDTSIKRRRRRAR